MYAFGAQIGNNFPPIELPQPRWDDLAPLGRAIRRRRTDQTFSPESLPRQSLSDLLWTACGADRRVDALGAPLQTDATYTQARVIDVYVALEHGLYLYDPERMQLVPVLRGDFRSLVAAPDLPRTGDIAPVRLVYVADVNRLEEARSGAATALRDPESQVACCLVDCGVVAANVYLFAAAAGLNAWFHDCDRTALAKQMPLRAGRRVLFGQTIGYPA